MVTPDVVGNDSEFRLWHRIVGADARRSADEDPRTLLDG
jgi:hypothetical protein